MTSVPVGISSPARVWVTTTELLAPAGERSTAVRSGDGTILTPRMGPSRRDWAHFAAVCARRASCVRASADFPQAWYRSMRALIALRADVAAGAPAAVRFVAARRR